MIDDVSMCHFRTLCAYYHFDIISVSSGFAYISTPEGDVILTLPTHGQRLGSLYHEVTARSRRGRFRDVQGEYKTRTPEEVWKRIEDMEEQAALNA